MPSKLEKEFNKAMDMFDKQNIERNFGPVFTFALGKFDDGRSGPLVLIMRGKKKLKPKYDKHKSLRYSHYIDTKDYVTLMHLKPFIEMFGKIKAGEIRYGRMKNRMLKRKKK